MSRNTIITEKMLERLKNPKKYHPFLSFYGGCELECAAQRMFEIYKITGRRVFVEEDFEPGMERAGIFEWNNRNYLIEKDNQYFPTDLFFKEVEEKIRELNPEYGKQFSVV